MKLRAATNPSADAVTTAAIGVLSAPLILLTHELLGHGVATLAFGAHIVRVTSVYENWSGVLSHPAARAIAAAGIAANLLYGALALLALRLVPKAHPDTRFFLWFFGHATIFMGSGYLMAGAIFHFGDPAQVLSALPSETAWRIAAAIIGFSIFFVTRLNAERILAQWAGNERRSTRARAFSLVPYFAMSIAATLSGFAGPDAHYSDVGWSALATFAANLPFGLFPFALPRPPADSKPLDLPRSRSWIAAGAIALAILFFILAPGVPRSRSASVSDTVLTPVADARGRRPVASFSRTLVHDRFASSHAFGTAVFRTSAGNGRMRGSEELAAARSCEIPRNAVSWGAGFAAAKVTLFCRK